MRPVDVQNQNGDPHRANGGNSLIPASLISDARTLGCEPLDVKVGLPTPGGRRGFNVLTGIEANAE